VMASEINISTLPAVLRSAANASGGMRCRLETILRNLPTPP
jgi:hypothetical protein